MQVSKQLLSRLPGSLHCLFRAWACRWQSSDIGNLTKANVQENTDDYPHGAAGRRVCLNTCYRDRGSPARDGRLPPRIVGDGAPRTCRASYNTCRPTFRFSTDSPSVPDLADPWRSDGRIRQGKLPCETSVVRFHAQDARTSAIESQRFVGRAGGRRVFEFGFAFLGLERVIAGVPRVSLRDMTIAKWRRDLKYLLGHSACQLWAAASDMPACVVSDSLPIAQVTAPCRRRGCAGLSAPVCALPHAREVHASSPRPTTSSAEEQWWKWCAATWPHACMPAHE